eukprot:6235573-Pyramimonas_sp.AAC.1
MQRYLTTQTWQRCATNAFVMTPTRSGVAKRAESRVMSPGDSLERLREYTTLSFLRPARTSKGRSFGSMAQLTPCRRVAETTCCSPSTAASPSTARSVSAGASFASA